ncbi:hypothetical protein DFH06DRAFT_259273 [Mycena polygramma]|nr:hypothetical protein DFH06DRAFT_259273 [Mycena polygramma]
MGAIVPARSAHGWMKHEDEGQPREETNAPASPPPATSTFASTCSSSSPSRSRTTSHPPTRSTTRCNLPTLACSSTFHSLYYPHAKAPVYTASSRVQAATNRIQLARDRVRRRPTRRSRAPAQRRACRARRRSAHGRPGVKARGLWGRLGIAAGVEENVDVEDCWWRKGAPSNGGCSIEEEDTAAITRGMPSPLMLTSTFSAGGVGSSAETSRRREAYGRS